MPTTTASPLKAAILFFRRPVRKRFSLIFHREFQVCFVFLLFIQPDKLFRKCPQQLFLLAPGFRQQCDRYFKIRLKITGTKLCLQQNLLPFQHLAFNRA